MRCSSCEPLLDAYLEASLGPLRGARVAGHLRACGRCAALLRELRVIDALLTTARPAGAVEPKFTAAVVSAAHAAARPPQRRMPIWLPVLAYLSIAWGLTAVVALRYGTAVTFAGNFIASQERGFAAVAAAVRVLAPATPLAAAAMTGVLLLDILLLCGVFYGYRRFRPLLALYLTRGSQP